MIKSKTVATISAFISMFFLGIGATIVGASARNIGLEAYQIGLLLGVQNIGFIIAVAISGALSDTWKKPTLLFIGSILLAIGFLGFYLYPNFILNLAVMLLIGMGMGTYEGTSDAMLFDIHETRQNMYINVNHFFVTFGSLVITSYLIFLQMNWRRSMIQSAGGVGILAVIFILLKVKEKPIHPDHLIKRLGFLLKEKKVLILFLTAAIAVGLEGGSIGILTTYMMESGNFTQITSKIILLLFLGGIATGRLMVGILAEEKRMYRDMLLLGGSGAVLFSLLYSLEPSNVSYPIVFLSGFTLSAMLPLIITMAGMLYNEMTGTVIGVVKVAIPIGGILIPFILSALTRYFPLNTAVKLFPVLSILQFIIFLTSQKVFRLDIKMGIENAYKK